MSETWTTAYEDKSESERSWTQPVPTDSLAIIDTIGLSPLDPIIDVGGGASYVVDNLVSRGFTDVTLLDLSPAALHQSRHRNGDSVTYLSADVTAWTPTRTWALWHDRAVFHFMITEEQRDAYRRALVSGTQLGSHVIIATFAPDGPEMCSGLPVTRWSAIDLAAEFSENFSLESHSHNEHTTPWGSVQPFTFVHLVRTR